jgi:glycosyltransferase involved in cell wall biosynthesis
MSKPLISVLVDTYNHEHLIEDAINSVLSQNFPGNDLEILVVDDGSTDKTPQILRKFAPKIRILTKPNGGQASAFNHGIAQCQGEFIAFLDGDDWWAPNKLSRVAEVLSADKQIGIVGNGIIESFPDGVRKPVTPARQERLRLNSLSAARTFRLSKSYLGTSRMTLRSDIARRIVPVPDKIIIEADEFLFTLAAALSDLVILPDALTYYRIHGANLYVTTGSDSGKRRKQQSLAALASSLNAELTRHGVPADAVNSVVEIIQAEADQLRLSLDGGSRWETVRTESKIFEVMHSDAPFLPRLFRSISMLPALILPPKWFYGGRQWLSSNSWYRNLRKNVVPVPEINHEVPSGEPKT